MAFLVLLGNSCFFAGNQKNPSKSWFFAGNPKKLSNSWFFAGNPRIPK